MNLQHGSDRTGCIAGSIAEAFYGVPDEMKTECRKRLPEDMLAVLERFLQVCKIRVPFDPFLVGNEKIESAGGRLFPKTCNYN